MNLDIRAVISAIMKDLGAIPKERKNTQQGYAFRGIDDMYAAIHPLFVKYGVFCAPRVLVLQTSEIEGVTQDGRKKVSYRTLLTIEHSFIAQDASSVCVTTVGEGLDTSDKSSNKAMSAAMKYAFIELFCVPTEDIADSDRDSPEIVKQGGTKLGREAEAGEDKNEQSLHSQSPPAPVKRIKGWPDVIVVPAGKNKGTPVGQLEIHTIKNDIGYWRTRETTEHQPLKGKVLEYVEALEDKLREMEKDVP